MEQYIASRITCYEPAEPLFSCDHPGVSDLAVARRANLIGGQRHHRPGFSVERRKLHFVLAMPVHQYYGPHITSLQAVLWKFGGQNNRVQRINHGYVS
jgi:hypothetical protein